MTVRFPHSEDDDPLGQVGPSRDAIPSRRIGFADGASSKTAEVVDFRELAESCTMLRFRVVVRVLE